MDISTETKDEKSLIKISGDFTIYDVNELKTSLLDAIAGTQETELNLAEITEFDSAALQLLALAKRTANNHNKTLRITAHSNSVADLLELYDLVGFFGDPLLISTQNLEDAISGKSE